MTAITTPLHHQSSAYLSTRRAIHGRIGDSNERRGWRGGSLHHIFSFVFFRVVVGVVAGCSVELMDRGEIYANVYTVLYLFLFFPPTSHFWFFPFLDCHFTSYSRQTRCFLSRLLFFFVLGGSCVAPLMQEGANLTDVCALSSSVKGEYRLRIRFCHHRLSLFSLFSAVLVK